jgi:hypothetical protein
MGPPSPQEDETKMASSLRAEKGPPGIENDQEMKEPPKEAADAAASGSSSGSQQQPEEPASKKRPRKGGAAAATSAPASVRSSSSSSSQQQQRTKDGRVYVEKNSLSEAELVAARDRARAKLQEPGATAHDRDEDRRASNRLASFQSRRRRIGMIEELEKSAAQLTASNQEKSETIEKQRREIEAFRKENERLRSQMVEQQQQLHDSSSREGSSRASQASAGGGDQQQQQQGTQIPEISHAASARHTASSLASAPHGVVIPFASSSGPGGASAVTNMAAPQDEDTGNSSTQQPNSNRRVSQMIQDLQALQKTHTQEVETQQSLHSEKRQELLQQQREQQQLLHTSHAQESQRLAATHDQERQRLLMVEGRRLSETMSSFGLTPDTQIVAMQLFGELAEIQKRQALLQDKMAEIQQASTFSRIVCTGDGDGGRSVGDGMSVSDLSGGEGRDAGQHDHSPRTRTNSTTHDGTQHQAAAFTSTTNNNNNNNDSGNQDQKEEDGLEEDTDDKLQQRRQA